MINKNNNFLTKKEKHNNYFYYCNNSVRCTDLIFYLFNQKSILTYSGKENFILILQETIKND